MDEYEEDLKHFTQMDLYFPEFILKTDNIFDDSIKYALSFLFFQTKQGHLCIKLQDDDILPSKPFTDNFLAFIRKGFLKITEYIFYIIICIGNIGRSKKYSRKSYQAKSHENLANFNQRR